ncbi:MAG: hypothetical protein RLZZ230_170 [Candidatus Parcubacteria bacterium]|jgi:phosphoribosylglycinamide formyltransferase-1
MSKKRLAVFVSGEGSILKAIIQQGLTVNLVIADRLCTAVEIAKRANIITIVLDRKKYKDDGVFNRSRFTDDVVAELVKYKIDFVALAGFMTVFAKQIFALYPDRIINTHPSLLPAFKGNQPVSAALIAGVKVTGATIHYVVDEVDSGRIIEQVAVQVREGDGVTKLQERIKKVERDIYPKVIRSLMSGSATWPSDLKIVNRLQYKAKK